MWMDFRKNLNVLVTVSALIGFVFLAGCGSDDDASPSYPKTVSVEYKITSSTGMPSVTLSYTNASGGTTTLANQSLPFSAKFNRTVNLNDVLSLGYGSNVGGTLKLEILVDNVVVKESTEPSNTPTTGAIVYLFP